MLPLVLADPVAPADGDAAAAFWAWLDRRVGASGRVDVVLTLHYHRRSAAAVVGRYPGRAALWAPEGSERRARRRPAGPRVRPGGGAAVCRCTGRRSSTAPEPPSRPRSRRRRARSAGRHEAGTVPFEARL